MSGDKRVADVARLERILASLEARISRITSAGESVDTNTLVLKASVEKMKESLEKKGRL